ncbi:MAG: SAM-dependent methyltransferase [Acidimicrobiales bacterium]|nr:SAM-dependent methyltransferase [Acidimicrobiales bacterium]
MKRSHWESWHDSYSVKNSDLSYRLEVVKQRLQELIERFEVPVRILSLCAGQGHDVIQTLKENPNLNISKALLVELDPKNVSVGESEIKRSGLGTVNYLEGDAANVSLYSDFVPVEILLLCGIFGNISLDDIKNTLERSSSFLAPGGFVVWTRHRKEPDATPAIRNWCAEFGYREIAFDTPDRHEFSVGTYELVKAPSKFLPDGKLFQFTSSC